MNAPPYLLTFFAAALGLVVAAIFIRSALQARANRDEERRRFERLRDAVRGIAPGAEVEDPVWSGPRIVAVVGDVHFTIRTPDPRRLTVLADSVEPSDRPLSHAWVLRHPSAWAPFAWAGLTPIGRRRPAWDRDGDWTYYLPATLHGYLSALDEGGGVEASLTVLRSLPGVKRFRLECDSLGIVMATLRLDSDDLLARPDRLESLLHHVRQVRTLLSA